MSKQMYEKLKTPKHKSWIILKFKKSSYVFIVLHGSEASTQNQKFLGWLWFLLTQFEITFRGSVTCFFENSLKKDTWEKNKIRWKNLQQI